MLFLFLGLLLFFLPHLLRELGLREPLLARLGSVGVYKGLYTLVALAGLGLIIYGKAVAPFILVYVPRFDLRWLSNLLMLPAFILVLAGNLPPGYLARALRHPMLAGVALWGVAHLWSNGDLASLLLFGSFAVWAVFKYCRLTLSGQHAGKSPAIIWDIVALVLGLAAYFLVFIYHGQLFGIGISIV